MTPEVLLNEETPATVEPEVGLTEGPVTPTETPENLEQKAQAINFAAPWGGSPEQIRSAIMQDTSWEPSFRQATSNRKAVEMQTIRNEIAKDWMLAKRESGEDFTPEDTQFIRDLSDESVVYLRKHDPSVILETLFAERAIKFAIEGDQSIEPFARGDNVDEDAEGQGPWERKKSVDPELLAQMSGADEAMAHMLTLRNIVQGEIADYENRNKDKSWARAGLETGFSMLMPFWSWVGSNDALGETSANSYLWGNNKQEQAEFFYSMGDPVEAKQRLKQAIAEYESFDPGGARAWLEGMLAYSYSSQLADNVFSSIEAGSVLPITSGGKLIKAARGAGSLAGGLKAMSAGMRARGPAGVPGAAAHATGHVTSTAYADVMNDIIRRATNQGQKKSAEDMLRDSPTMFNIHNTITPTIGLTKDVADSIVQQLEEATSMGLRKYLIDPVNVTRVDMADPTVAAAVKKDVEDLFNAQYPSLSRNVLGFRHLLQEENLTTNDLVAVQLTKKDKSLWDDEASALNSAKKWKLENAYAVQHPSGQYYLEVTKSIDENAESILQAMLSREANQTPDANINMFIGALAAKNAKVSQNFAQDIEAATYGRSSMFDAVSKHVEGINEVTKASREKLRTFLIRERDTKATPTSAPGVHAFNQSMLEYEWRRQFGADITENEVRAYWLFRNFNEMDYWVRNARLYSAKSRLGLENHYIRVPIDVATAKSYGTAVAAANKKKLPIPAAPKWGKNYAAEPLEGKTVGITQDGKTGDYVFPWSHGEKNTTILYIGDDGIVGHFNKSFMTKAQKDMIVRDVSTRGTSTITQLSPFQEEKLARILGEENVPRGHVAFIVSPSNKVEALPLRQLNKRPGYHREVADGYFLSQANTTRAKGSANADITIYKGDKNHSHYVMENDGKKMEKLINDARIRLLTMRGVVDPVAKARMKADLKAFLAANLPYSWKDFRKQFKEYNKDGVFSVYEPFLMRKSGTRLADQHNLKDYYANFDDLLNNEYNLYKGQVDLQYAMERNDDIHTVVDNIVSPAEQLDPFVAYEKSAARLANSGYLEDVKLKQATLILSEFRDIFDASADELINNPLKHIIKPKYLNKIDPKRKAQFRGARRVLMETLNVESDFTKNVNIIKRNISNYIAENVENIPWVGGKITKRQAYDITENLWKMAIMKDPAQFIKSFAFHTKIGLFNPLQWFMQAQGIAHTAAIEGLPRAYQASAAAFLMRGPLINPDMTVDFAKRAAKLGWNQEDFIESFDALRRSGFGHVGREFGNLADLENGRVVQSNVGWALDKAGYFFKEGERMNRLVAWNAAYLRWKAKNPGKHLMLDRDISEIRNRADMLTLRMSQGSNAMWQKGWMGVPTQFMSYQARLTGQLLGRELSGAERLRAFAAYSAFYGMPIGLTGTALGGFWSTPKDIQAALLDQGIDVDESLLLKTMTRGIADVAFNTMTDEDLAFGERFGPGGNTLLRDLVNGDTSIWEALMGASGKTLAGNQGGILYGTFGLVGTMIGATLSAEEDFLPLTGEALHNLAATVSTYNNMSKGWHALQTGAYASRNGLVLDNVSPGDAAIMMLTGTQPQDISKAFSELENVKAYNTNKQEAMKQYAKYLKLSLKSLDSPEDAAAYASLAKYHLQGLTPRDKQQALREALKNEGAFVDSIAKQHSQISPEKFQMYLRRLQRNAQ